MRLKYGISIDGKIANQRKESKWITSEDSRTFVQSKRAEVNAILTTCNTVIDDNPYMNIREKKIKDLITNQPALIVLDAKMRIPVTSNIFKTKNRLVIIITDSKNTNNRPIKTYSENVVIKYVNTFNNGKVNLKDIYEIANTYDLNDILIECGNTFSRYLIKENAVDEFMLFVAPKIIGDKGYTFSGIDPVQRLKDKISLRISEIMPIKNDLYINLRKQ